MTPAEIIDDFPELNTDDISACLRFAVDRENSLIMNDKACIEFMSN